MNTSKLKSDIARYFGINEAAVEERLSRGFGYQHQKVAEDFRSANPGTDGEFLMWYLNTEAYIWELAAYHMDPGFNYVGMCKGITDRLVADNRKHVLNLGDGIGTLTLACMDAGLDACYHDLFHSRTAEFAASRCSADEWQFSLSTDWNPPTNIIGGFDAVVSLDFLEHVTDVPRWAKWIYEVLKPGGVMLAQNAFGIGSGPNGSMPMHLERNDRFERDWVPLLLEIGFTQIETSNWWLK